MNRNQTIDLFRFIAAFFILCLHNYYGNVSSEIVENIRVGARWAVPFFFMCSGYFLKSKIESNNIFDFKCIEKNIVNLISVLFISSIVYFFFHWVQLDVRALLLGAYWHLWFLGSMIFGFVFIWYIFYLRLHRLMWIISISILFFVIISDSYDQFLGLNIDYQFFRFLQSIPFIYIGYRISLIDKPVLSKNVLLVFIMVGFILQYAEVYMFEKLFNYSRYEHSILIGTIVLLVPGFIYLTRVHVGNTLFSNWGRKYSLFIYLYHLLLFHFFDFILLRLFSSEILLTIRPYYPVLGLFAITGLAIILEKYFTKVYEILNGNFSYISNMVNKSGK